LASKGSTYQILVFLILDIFDLHSNFLCLRKAQEASKVRPSEGITAGKKFGKYNFTQHITFNGIFGLLDGQPTQSHTIFDF